MATRVLVIDNYDSFVYNLVQELGELGAEPVVHRNDAIDVDGIRAAAPDAVLISPGPGRPEDAGISLAVIEELAGELPILGVCLGHQAIGQAFGGEIVRAPPRRRRGVHRTPGPLHRHPLPLPGSRALQRAR
jgi:anthranilate synthase/aminodeoxychorismate synthase-like glutamine amidotransferase